MTDLGFTDDMAQQFVNGAMKGFTDYVRRRKEDADKLIVSRGATWMKGNYIDDGVAKELATQVLNIRERWPGIHGNIFNLIFLIINLELIIA